MSCPDSHYQGHGRPAKMQNVRAGGSVQRPAVQRMPARAHRSVSRRWAAAPFHAWPLMSLPGAHEAAVSAPVLCSGTSPAACPSPCLHARPCSRRRAVTVSTYPDRGRRACDKPRSRSPSSASWLKQALTLKTLTPDLASYSYGATEAALYFLKCSCSRPMFLQLQMISSKFSSHTK